VGECASAGDLASYAEQAGGYEPTAEVIDYLNETAAFYEASAALLETAQRMLDSMCVLSMGKGVRAYLSATGERNVAELATAGPGGAGHNLHPLSKDMKGWWSLRAEGGSIIIVRWSNDAPPLQVARTGTHDTGSGGDIYKYDQTLATEFTPLLAWTAADGKGMLG
jgi:mRNA-degrading endonuclease YafQ of YafQ-DinJ toxin-antitoxin module